MAKRVLIIHGWEDQPDAGWFPGLQRFLESKGSMVLVPAMPNPSHPAIGPWTETIATLVGRADAETCFVGHSIGSQAILRYIESLPSGTKIGGVVLVAPWLTLKPEATPDEASKAVVKEWLETPLKWNMIRPKVQSATVIMSTSDPFVPTSDAENFRRDLGAEVIIEPGPGHLSGADGLTELPSLWQAAEQMIS